MLTATYSQNISPNNALHFDGIDDYIIFPYNETLNPLEYTIELWVKSDNEFWNSTGSLISMREKFVFHPVVSTKTIQFLVFEQNYYYYVEYTIQTDITNWHHYAATYNSKEIKLYVDGNLVASAKSKREPAISKVGDLFIGCDSRHNNRYFNGVIDEIRIWDYEKKQKEIQNWMDYELYGNEKGLIFYLDFNQGSPNIDNNRDTLILDLANNSRGKLNNFFLNGDESNWVKSGVEIKGKAKEDFFLLKYIPTEIVILFLGSIALVLIVLFVRILYQKKISQKLSIEVVKKTKELSEENKIKDALIAEIHHRVKNNLQTISGLIYFQMSDSQSENEKDALKKVQNRVLAMASIHEKLYSNNNMTKTNIRNLVFEIVDSIKNLNNDHSTTVLIEYSIDDIEINISTAITFGQLLAEIITNSFKHAFSNQKDPKIYIEIHRVDDFLKIIVADNGCGMKDKNRETDTLGLNLISIFAKQLKAKIDIFDETGMKYILSFKI